MILACPCALLPRDLLISDDVWRERGGDLAEERSDSIYPVLPGLFLVVRARYASRARLRCIEEIDPVEKPPIKWFQKML